MISRTVIGKSFRGVVRYQFNGRRDAPSDKQPEILAAVGVRETSADEMLEDFNRRRRQNADLGNAVWHTTLSFNPADAARLDSAQMLLIAERWLHEMKLDQTQYTIIRHHDQQDNQHVHIVANRVDNAGQTISDKHNFFAARRVNKLLEAEFNLTPARGSSQPELQHPERIDGPDKARAEIRQAIGRALAAGVSERGELLEVLRAQHITAREFSTKAGVVTGISFAKDGHTFKGSEVARDYGLAGLEKQLARNREAALAAEQQAEAQRREAARLETKTDLTKMRDSGLSYPAQFFDRLRTQPYELQRNPQTQELTHVRHQVSGEVFAWAEVQPGGPGAPPLADQLTAAVAQTRQQAAQAEAAHVAQQQLVERQRQQAAQAEAVLQTNLRTVLLAGLDRQVPTATSIPELQAKVGQEGISVRPVFQADGQLQDLFFTTTAYLGREVSGGELAPAYAAEALSRQLAQQATQRAVEQQAALAALAGMRQEQAAIQALKFEIDQADRQGSSGKVTDLRSGNLLETEKRLADYQAQAEATPSGRALLADYQAQAQLQGAEQARLEAEAQLQAPVHQPAQPAPTSQHELQVELVAAPTDQVPVVPAEELSSVVSEETGPTELPTSVLSTASQAADSLTRLPDPESIDDYYARLDQKLADWEAEQNQAAWDQGWEEHCERAAQMQELVDEAVQTNGTRGVPLPYLLRLRGLELVPEGDQFGIRHQTSGEFFSAETVSVPAPTVVSPGSDLVQYGRIKAGDWNGKSGWERVEGWRLHLEKIGVIVGQLAPEEPGKAACLDYCFQVEQPNLTQVMISLGTIQHLRENTKLHEAPHPLRERTVSAHGLAVPAGQWPERQGQFGEADILVDAIHSHLVPLMRAELVQDGAIVQESEPTGQQRQLHVIYHTHNNDSARVNATLDAAILMGGITVQELKPDQEARHKGASDKDQEQKQNNFIKEITH